MVMEPHRRKRRPEPKIEFEAGKVFDVKPAFDVELELESATYLAQKGQGGDRNQSTTTGTPKE